MSLGETHELSQVHLGWEEEGWGSSRGLPRIKPVLLTSGRSCLPSLALGEKYVYFYSVEFFQVNLFASDPKLLYPNTYLPILHNTASSGIVFSASAR